MIKVKNAVLFLAGLAMAGEVAASAAVFGPAEKARLKEDLQIKRGEIIRLETDMAAAEKSGDQKKLREMSELKSREIERICFIKRRLAEKPELKEGLNERSL